MQGLNRWKINLKFNSGYRITDYIHRVSILITIAKFLGLALSTILGIIAIIGKSHEEIEVKRLILIPGSPETEKIRRLTKWGKLSLLGIIIGGVVGLTALIFDSINQYNQSRQSQIRTEEQLQLARMSLSRIEEQSLLAQNTLDHIQHVVLRFESLKVIAKLEVSASVFDLRDLINDEDKSKFTNLISSSYHEYFVAQRVLSSPLESAAKTNTATLDDSWLEGSEELGVFAQSNRTFSSILGENTSTGFNLVVPISLKILEHCKKPNGITDDEKSRMLNFLRSPKTTLSIWRADSDRNTQAPDFIASTEVHQNIKLDYLFPSDHIRITMICDYPESNWTHNAKITSLPDLSQAFVNLSLNNYPNKMQPENSETSSFLDNHRVQDRVFPTYLKIVFNEIPIFAEIYPSITFNTDDIVGILPKKQDYTPKDLSDFRNEPTPAANREFRIRSNQLITGLHLIASNQNNSANIILAWNNVLPNQMAPEKDAAEAIIYLSQIIRSNPTNAAAYNNRGYAKIYLKDYTEGIVDLNKAIKLNPKYTEAYENRAKLKIITGENADAINDLTKVIESDPTNADAYFYRSIAKLNLKNFADVIADLNLTIKLNPKYVDAYLNRGSAKYNSSDFKGAKDDYDRVIEFDPTNIDAYDARASAKFNLSDYKGAKDDYDKVINFDDKNTDAYNNRGNTKFNLKDYKGAIIDYDKVIKSEPNNVDVLFNHGNAKLNLGDYKGAIADYDKCIKLEPNNADAMFNRGSAKLYLKDYKEAESDYTKAIELDPKNAEAYCYRGSTKYCLKDYIGEKIDSDKAIELNPKLAAAYSNRGLAKLNLKDDAGAKIDFDKAAKLHVAENSNNEVSP